MNSNAGHPPPEELLGRLVETIAACPKSLDGEPSAPLLPLAAAAYRSGVEALAHEVTRPTGFDPQGGELFESLVEAAFLVANAGGVFDSEAQARLRGVVVAASHGEVTDAQMDQLIARLARKLQAQGEALRVTVITRSVQRPVHRYEVLRIAALLGAAGGLGEPERRVLRALAAGFAITDEGLEGLVRLAEGAAKRSV